MSSEIGGLHLHSGDYTYTLKLFSNYFAKKHITLTLTFKIVFGNTNVI